MKNYNKATLINWNKKDLVDRIIELQTSYDYVYKSNMKLLKVVMQAKTDNKDLASEIDRILSEWKEYVGDYEK